MNLLELPVHFLRPWWWLALLPLPVLLWMVARADAGRRALARLVDATLLPHLVQGQRATRWIAVALTASGWLLAVAALAGPAWQKDAAPLYASGTARVIVLSLSDHMLAQDLKPDRLTRAKFAVRDLLDAAGDAHTALVAYAGAAFTVAPLTDDKNTVENLLGALGPDVMPVAGNDAAAGLRMAVDLLQHAHAEGGDIVLVTDATGHDAVQAAGAAHAQGMRVDVLGVGTPDGAPVPRRGGGFVYDSGRMVMARRDDASLRAVAQAGGGRYAVLRADGRGPADLGPPPHARGHASSSRDAVVWRDGGVWLLPLLVVVAALAFRRGWLAVLAVVLLPMTAPTASAASWASLWANRDQRALAALQSGDAHAAQAMASTPPVQGVADYRAGDYADAARAFAKAKGARAYYNLGNAQAQLGEYPKAVAAYKEALARDPGFADARANLAAVEDWMRRHPQEQARGTQQGKPGGAAGSSGGNAAGKDGAANPGQTAPGAGDDHTRAAPGTSPGGNGSGAPGDAGNSPDAGQDGGATTSEDARQRRQAAQAGKALEHELGHARGQGQAASAPAFALGRNTGDPDSKFSAQQRALLQAVPDDPGALLRNKFRLEWQRRHAGGKP